MSNKTVAIVFGAMLALFATVATAQNIVTTLRLNGGESAVVECTSGRNLAVERSPDRKSALLTCRGQSQPEPTETPVTPEPTVQPTVTTHRTAAHVSLCSSVPAALRLRAANGGAGRTIRVK